MGKFQKGHKLARGGKRANAGRPRKKDLEMKKAAQEIAREAIENHAHALLKTYLGLACGSVVERTTKKGIKKYILSVDPATTRHAIDKLLPEIDPSKHVRPIAVQIIHEGPTQDVEVKSNGNGVAIHIGDDE